MINTVKNFLNKYNIKNKTVILGFSSGPDSCALAVLLNQIKKEYNLKIVLAYFNHNWRIKEAKEEEVFTKKFAEKFNNDFIIEKAANDEAKTEENARKLRYDFFLRCSKKFNSDFVFLAHNKNDNIETLIYRIIKGTSIKGLASIPEQREIYYRPLLETTKKEILDFLKVNNQDYMIDSSNENIKYKRNLIRNKILPLFEEINPNYINNINNLIKNSIDAKNIIEEKIHQTKKEIVKNNTIEQEKFLNLKQNLRLEFLNDYLGKLLKNRDCKTLVKLDNFILNNKNSKTSINSNTFLKIKENKVFIENKKEKNKEEIIINDVGEYAFENKIIKIEKQEETINSFPKSSENFCFLNFDFPISIRHRKNGDLFSPCGLKGTMKLKDYLINEKIKQEKKDELNLICKNKEILWIIGYRINEKYKVQKKPYYKISWRENNGKRH